MADDDELVDVVPFVDYELDDVARDSDDDAREKLITEAAEEIEEMMESFILETPIQHNVIPESDPESEEEDNGRSVAMAPARRGGELYLGKIFPYKEAFCEVVLDYAIKNGRNIKQHRYDKTKVGYKCDGGKCNWKVYCARVGDCETWEVRIYQDKHSCIPNGKCDLLKVPVIAVLFMNRIRIDPDLWMPMKIEETIMSTWKIRVSRGQCQVARKKALKMIEREYEMQFARLKDYMAEIEYSNPGSTVAVETLRSETGLDLFNRLYICFDALKKSWKDTCRHVIGVDGCHLKSNMKGQLLVAIGRDANNCIYSIAWGVVQVEDTPNWLWFLRKLKSDLNLGDGDNFVLCSDRQKGLLNVVEQEFPKFFDLGFRMGIMNFEFGEEIKPD